MNFLTSSAQFSNCRTYRYDLVRIWDHSLPYCAFICLNPSTADEKKNDPTVKRCITYANDWGYGGFIMLNMFAYRATDPEDMKTYREPIGPDNNKWILRWVDHPKVRLVVLGWGNHGTYNDRDKEMKELLKEYEVACLTTTASDQPGHPLYLKKNLKPIKYNWSK